MRVTLTPQQRAELLDLLWDSLKRDPEHQDRRRTGWGTKTKLGLIACIERIGSGEGQINAGREEPIVFPLPVDSRIKEI